MQRGGGKCCWTQVKCLGAGVGMCTEDRGEEERKAEGLDGWWEEVCATSELRGEEKYIFPFQESADVMFNSALVYELAVLKTYAEPLLFQIPRDSAEYQEAKRLLKFLDYFLPLPTEDIAQNSLMREFIGGSCFHV